MNSHTLNLTPKSCAQVLNGTSWVPWALINYWRADYMVKAWDTLFQPSGEFGGLPERVQGSITSEFFVTRDRRVPCGAWQASCGGCGFRVLGFRV